MFPPRVRARASGGGVCWDSEFSGACHTPRVGGRSRVGAPIRGGTRAADGPGKHPKHLKIHIIILKQFYKNFCQCINQANLYISTDRLREL